jgi:hypothetical protein
MDKTTQEIQKLLRRKNKVLLKNDIEEVLIGDLGDKGNFSLVRVNSETAEKFGGNQQVIAAMRRLSTSPGKREGYFNEMMAELLKTKQMRELMVVDATDEAKEFIKTQKH